MKVTALRSAALAPWPLALAGCAGGAVRPMQTMTTKSDLSEWIRVLFFQITAWDALIFAIVVVALLLAVFVFSTRVGEAAPPSGAVSSLGLEAVWTIGPALVILMISIPTVRTIFRTQSAKPPPDALIVEVIGHQWWWEFQYPALRITTANELHLPAGRPVRLLLSSGDLIHSFWIPQLGGKRDCIPGHVNEITLIPRVPGGYWGECAEFCGTSHANMRFRAIVEGPAQFAAWTKAQLAAPADLTSGPAGAGALEFANSPCTTCHTIEGVSSGKIGPDLSHFAGRATLAGGLLPNTPRNLAAWLRDPQRIKPGAQMPGLALSGDQLDEMVAYLEGLK